MPEIGNRIRNGIRIPELEQRSQLLLIKFIYPNAYIVGEDKFKKRLLLAIKVLSYRHFGPRSAFLTRERREGISHISKHVKKIALLRVDDFLHLDQ